MKNVMNYNWKWIKPNAFTNFYTSITFRQLDFKALDFGERGFLIQFKSFEVSS